MSNTFTDQFMSNDKNLKFVQAAMMGPNAMRVAEELASHLNINKTMRVLDLGCGCGLSTILLTQKYGASVFAADLWISPTDNYERFQFVGIDDKTIPVSVDATKGLPFANRYFDILFSVGAYQFFGDTADMLSSLIPFVKKGGYIAISLNGIKQEFGKNVPEEMQPYWNNPEIARTIHSIDWWEALWSQEKGIEILDISEMSCHKQTWDEWLNYPSDGPFAEFIEEDIKMMEAEGGKYFNTIQLIARVKE